LVRPDATLPSPVGEAETVGAVENRAYHLGPRTACAVENRAYRLGPRTACAVENRAYRLESRTACAVENEKARLKTAPTETGVQDSLRG